jgi:hypothetical protein
MRLPFGDLATGGGKTWFKDIRRTAPGMGIAKGVMVAECARKDF